MLDVRFAPSAIEASVGRLVISSDAGQRSVALSGNGIGRPAIEVAPSQVNFGAVKAGAGVKPRRVQITSVGSDTLVLRSPSSRATADLQRPTAARSALPPRRNALSMSVSITAVRAHPALVWSSRTTRREVRRACRCRRTSRRLRPRHRALRFERAGPPEPAQCRTVLPGPQCFSVDHNREPAAAVEFRGLCQPICRRDVDVHVDCPGEADRRSRQRLPSPSRSQRRPRRHCRPRPNRHRRRSRLHRRRIR